MTTAGQKSRRLLLTSLIVRAEPDLVPPEVAVKTRPRWSTAILKPSSRPDSQNQGRPNGFNPGVTGHLSFLDHNYPSVPRRIPATRSPPLPGSTSSGKPLAVRPLSPSHDNVVSAPWPLSARAFPPRASNGAFRQRAVVGERLRPPARHRYSVIPGAARIKRSSPVTPGTNVSLALETG